MTHVFTSEEILAYVYGELDAETTAKLEAMLPHEDALRNEVTLYRESKALLEQVPLQQPSNKTLESIMRYAAERSAEKHGVELYQ
jgi:anti-sigma factor RsiW